MKAKILLVDDEPDLLDILGDFLEENGYEIHTAKDGQEALDILEKESCDLLLSDINMPRVKGFELLRRAKEKYPSMKSALITAYDVNDYIRFARDEGIGNIITKTSPFNYEEVLSMVQNLVSEDIFGIERYLDPGTSIASYEIRKPAEIDEAIEKVCKNFNDKEQDIRFRRVLREILTNAVFYGSKDEKGDEKQNWDIDSRLKEGEFVTIYFAKDADKFAVSVVDKKGRLDKGEVLYWLDRNITRGGDGLPLSIHDVHGRGLFISRESIDRFIINTKQGAKTEIISIQYKNEKYKGFRPLLIYEL